MFYGAPVPPPPTAPPVRNTLPNSRSAYFREVPTVSPTVDEFEPSLVQSPSVLKRQRTWQTEYESQEKRPVRDTSDISPDSTYEYLNNLINSDGIYTRYFDYLKKIQHGACQL
jgi:hypothetical protein